MKSLRENSLTLILLVLSSRVEIAKQHEIKSVFHCKVWRSREAMSE